MANKMTDEQKNWMNKQMGSRKVTANGNGGSKPDEFVYKYSSGVLRESVIIAGVPYYIKKSFIETKNEYTITVDPHIEETTKILKPPFKQICPFIPYEFASTDEPKSVFKKSIKRNSRYINSKNKNPD